MTVEDILGMLRSRLWVHAGAADSPEISAMLARCADACFDLNNMRPSMKEEHRTALEKLLGKAAD